MLVTQAESGTPPSAWLKSWSVPPRRIGSRTYRGKCVVAEALHVQYQKESSVVGYNAGIVGMSRRGTGMTLGGGGFTTTRHRDVVQVVFRDQDGAEQVQELPAQSAATVGCVTRLDMIGDQVIGCTNLSGKGRLLQLMDSSSFIAVPRVSRRYILLALLSVVCLYNGLGRPSATFLGWGIMFAIAPVWRAWRIAQAKQHRRELDRYMGAVFA